MSTKAIETLIDIAKSREFKAAHGAELAANAQRELEAISEAVCDVFDSDSQLEIRFQSFDLLQNIADEYRARSKS